MLPWNYCKPQNTPLCKGNATNKNNAQIYNMLQKANKICFYHTKNHDIINFTSFPLFIIITLYLILSLDKNNIYTRHIHLTKLLSQNKIKYLCNYM